MGLLDVFTTESTDAISMLKQDHEKVKRLFKEFEDAEDSRTKQRIVRDAIGELEVHATLEEQIFYPAVRKTDDDEEHQTQMDEALEEHHVAKMLIAELKQMGPRDERYDAKFLVLSESVKHHIDEEESEVLPKAKEGGLDLVALGRLMAERKRQLMQGSGNVAAATAEREGKTRIGENRRPAQRAVKQTTSRKRAGASRRSPVKGRR